MGPAGFYIHTAKLRVEALGDDPPRHGFVDDHTLVDGDEHDAIRSLVASQFVLAVGAAVVLLYVISRAIRISGS